jgi:hypothetical protein
MASSIKIGSNLENAEKGLKRRHVTYGLCRLILVEIKPRRGLPMNLSERNWVPQDQRNELREGFGDGSQNRNQKGAPLWHLPS